jgi:alpha-tubulin suppressor-like RCC1 family protein
MHPFPSAMMQGTASLSAPFKLYAWGANGSGQLGLGNTTTYTSPKQVGSLLWNTVAAALNHTVAIRNNGTLWAWGANGQGQLGDGTTVSKSSPIQIGALSNWAFVFASSTNSFAVKNDGTLWAWGKYTTLGDGTTVSKSSPVQIGALTDWIGGSGRSMGDAILFRKSNGTLWAWGSNGAGQLGQGDTTTRYSPTQIGALTDWASIGAAGSVGFAVKSNGTLWSWGRNSVGQLGLGTSGPGTYRSSPVQVGALTTWAFVTQGPFNSSSHAWATTTAGGLWAWGYNGSGQLGDGTTTSRSSPVQIGALTNWNPNAPPPGLVDLPLAGSTYSSGAVKSDRTLWASGNGGFTPTSVNSPVQIGSANTWCGIAAGGSHVLGLLK